MRRLTTAVALIALVAGPAHAQGNGRGNEQGGAQGGGHSASGQQLEPRGGGKPAKAQGSQRGGGKQAFGEPNDRANTGRGQGNGNSDSRGGKPSGKRQDARASGAARAIVGDANRGNVERRSGNGTWDGDRGRGHGGWIVDHRGRVDVVRIDSFSSAPGRGLIAGCPPGLAKKNPPCVPPGQVRYRSPHYDRPDFWGLRLRDGRYRYGDGYLFRLGPDGRVGGFIPLLGGALAIGHVWPTFYQPVALPTYYESYYGLGGSSSYRYADNVIYRVDPETAAITSIAALLTGDDFTVGRPMPAGYDVYNVPYSYRDQYYDRPDAHYRYSDGYIYQVDPETRLIAAAIELIAT